MGYFSIQTITALVEVVTGGPDLGDRRDRIGIYRTGPKLEQFLGAAGIELHIGSNSRVPSVRGVLITANESDHDAVVRLIEQIADSREYLSYPEKLKAVVEYLNARLRGDGYELVQIDEALKLRPFPPTKAVAPATEEKVETQKSDKREQEGMVEPKPPEFLQNALWILKYGRKYLPIIAIVCFVLAIPQIIKLLPKEGPFVSETIDVSENQNSGSQSVVSKKGDGDIYVTQSQGVDPKEYGETQRVLGKTEQKLKQIMNEKQELEKIVNTYKKEDKERRAILTQADNIEKTKLLVKIFQEQDKGNISKEEASKLSGMVNKALWEDLKSFIEDKNIKIDKYNQSLVVSGIFKAKVTGGGYRARYNPATIVYVLTPEGNKLYEIAKTEENRITGNN